MSEISAQLNPTLSAEQAVDDGGIAIGEILDLLRSRIKTILFITITIAIIGQIIIAFSPRIYVTSGLVQVEPTEPSSASTLTALTSLLTGAPTQTAAELQVLQSRLVMDKVIDKLNLEIQVEPHYFPVVGKIVTRDHPALAAALAGAPGLSRFAWGGELASVSRFELPPAWIGTRLTLVANGNGGYTLKRGATTVLTGKVGQLASANGISILVTELEARPNAEFSVYRLMRQAALASIGPPALTVAEQGDSSGVIRISFKGTSPDFATRVVEAIQFAYVQQNVERRSQDAEQSLVFLRRQMPDLQAKMEAIQQKLATYQKSNNLVDIIGETKSVLDQSVAMEAERLKLEQDRLQLVQRFKPQHPAVKLIDQQIAALGAQQADLERRTHSLPDAQQQVFDLTRDAQANTQLYTAMLQTIQGLEISRAGTVGNVRILDYPLRPMQPDSPKTGLMTMVSLFLGVAVGVGLVLLQRMMVRGIDDPLVLEQRFRIPSYATIPYVPEQAILARSIKLGQADWRILAVAQPSNPAIEAMRSLRTALQLLSLEASNNVVMVTSPHPRAGKSFVSANLGAVLASGGKRVVLIDADMRRGNLHEAFSAAVSPGLSEALLAGANAQDFVRTSGVHNLSFIPRGAIPPNPNELLLPPNLETLLQQLSGSFDYVLIDTPPVLPVADAAVIGRLCGTVLMTLKSGEHSNREIQYSLARLQTNGVRTHGFVLNQVGAKAGTYGYQGYGYVYSYGYAADDTHSANFPSSFWRKVSRRASNWSKRRTNSE